MTEKDEGIPADDGTEESTTGYMRHGDYNADAQEESLSGTEEPEEEVDELEQAKEELEDEEESEEEEEEPGDEDEEEEEEFLVKEVSPELVEERKALQRAYSEKFQELGALRLRANLVDAIDRNPEETLKTLAKRYGVDLGTAVAEEFELPEVDIVPKEDEELPSYMKRLIQGSLKGLPKMIQDAVGGAVKGDTGATEQKLENDKIQATLKYLNDTYSDWGIYEERMIELVQRHPSLRHDPDELYKLAKGSPSKIRADSKRKRTKTKLKNPKSGERGKKVVKLASKKGKIMSFDEAWNAAKAELKGGK